MYITKFIKKTVIDSEAILVNPKRAFVTFDTVVMKSLLETFFAQET